MELRRSRESGELTFKSKIGVFTASQIRDAVQKSGGSIRGAAKLLNGLQDSTLRGWLNKLPDIETNGPNVPNVAKVGAPPMAPTTVLIFKTTDGREFTSTDVTNAILQNRNSNRAAARALAVGESTIRGWRAKAGF